MPDSAGARRFWVSRGSAGEFSIADIAASLANPRRQPDVSARRLQLDIDTRPSKAQMATPPAARQDNRPNSAFNRRWRAPKRIN